MKTHRSKLSSLPRIYFLCLFCFLGFISSLSGQRPIKGYVILDDSSATYLQGEIDLGNLRKEQRIQLRLNEKAEPMVLGPSDVRAFGLFDRSYFLPYTLTGQDGVAARIFLRQVQSGDFSLFKRMDREKGFFVFTPDSTILAVPRGKEERRSFFKQLETSCPIPAKEMPAVAYQQSSLRRALLFRTDCRLRRFPGAFLRVQGGIRRFGLELSEIQSTNWSADGAFSLSPAWGMSAGLEAEWSPLRKGWLALVGGVSYSSFQTSGRTVSGPTAEDMELQTDFLQPGAGVKLIWPRGRFFPYLTVRGTMTLPLQSESFLAGYNRQGSNVFEHFVDDPVELDTFTGFSVSPGVEIPLRNRWTILVEAHYAHSTGSGNGLSHALQETGLSLYLNFL